MEAITRGLKSSGSDAAATAQAAVQALMGDLPHVLGSSDAMDHQPQRRQLHLAANILNRLGTILTVVSLLAAPWSFGC